VFFSSNRCFYHDSHTHRHTPILTRNDTVHALSIHSLRIQDSAHPNAYIAICFFMFIHTVHTVRKRYGCWCSAPSLGIYECWCTAPCLRICAAAGSHRRHHGNTRTCPLCRMLILAVRKVEDAYSVLCIQFENDRTRSKISSFNNKRGHKARTPVIIQLCCMSTKHSLHSLSLCLSVFL
jgi:hypothetical protein